MQKGLKVSVCMITYGHEQFIREAIEGVLMQECDFAVELILANDCSPDQTDSVIQDILSNHPKASWIKYFKNEKNKGMMPNFIFAMQQCQGQFIALCEGDDYWIDPLKLQKQVDFLETNPEYVIHSSAAKIIRGDVLNDEIIGLDINRKIFDETNFYSQNHLVTCTVMFRNDFADLLKHFPNVTFGDWFLYIMILNHSKLKAYRSCEFFSVYRIHESGVMMSLSLLKYQEMHINQILKIKKYIGYKNYSLLTISRINDYSIEKFKIELNNKMYRASFYTFLNNFLNCKKKTAIKRYLSVIKHSVIRS